ncbi:MAG TPA: ABC transporter substrate-binding protein [Xanthobacteraceae bacterium]
MVQQTRLRILAYLACASCLFGTTAHAAAAAKPTQITVSYSEKTVDFLPLWIASDAGYFRKHGLDVTLRYLPAQEGIPALITGQVQIAGIGGSDAVSAEAQGAKLKLVLTLTPTYIFQFWARPQFANADALKGQRIGVTSATGSLYAGTLLALKELGLTAKDVILTPLGSVTNVNNSLLAGSIAAAASHPPATYEFKRAGLVDLVDLAKKRIPSVSAGIWVTQSFIAANRGTVQNTIDAVIEAIGREKSDRAVAENEIREHLGVTDQAQLDFTYDFYTKEALPAQPMPDAAQLQSNVQALSASNPRVATVNVAAMLDRSFVTDAEKDSAGGRN